MKIKPVTNGDGTPYGVRFDCPGCDEAHVVPTAGPNAWGFNGSLERPTLTPSVRVDERGRWDGTKKVALPGCHSQVTDGRIHFYADSGHALAGQTVDLPEVAQ